MLALSSVFVLGYTDYSYLRYSFAFSSLRCTDVRSNRRLRYGREISDEDGRENFNSIVKRDGALDDITFISHFFLFSTCFFFLSPVYFVSSLFFVTILVVEILHKRKDKIL